MLELRLAPESRPLKGLKHSAPEGSSNTRTFHVYRWDPDKGEAATDDSGCANEAVWLLGSNGLWRVCDYCSKLGEFRKLRKRVRIRRSPPGLMFKLESGDG